MNSPENQDQAPERPAGCLLDCLSPSERRRAILGDEIIAEIHARVDEAPDPPPELVEQLRRIMTRPAGKVPPPPLPPLPPPPCQPITFAEAEATFGPECTKVIKRGRRKAPQPAPEQLLCGKRLIDLFGEPEE